MVTLREPVSKAARSELHARRRDSLFGGPPPNKPLQLTGYSEPRLGRVALGNVSHCRCGKFRRPAAERRIR